MSNGVPKGAVVSSTICVHVPAFAGLTENWTRAAPPPVVAASETVPERTAPGSVRVTLGPVESTVTGMTAVVRALPAASVITARISVAPSGAEVEFQAASYGAVASLATVAKLPLPNSLTCHSTSTTPEPDVSAALAPSATVGPPTVAPAAGAVTLPVGWVRSTRTTRGALVETLPPPSVATAISSHCCSATGGVDHVTPNGAVASEPIAVPAPRFPSGR